MDRPNFIVFVTDDQGYGDLSCMGATDFRTPYLDDLAATGARFTSWYSNAPVCSPSRASLLTGRYPCHAGVRSILSGARKASGLQSEVPTLASVLKEQGYQTGIFGKWHLGVSEECRPPAHGFDEWMGFLAGCIDYYSHIYYWEMNMGGAGNDPTHDLWINGEEVWDNGRYFTEMITDYTVNYIREAAQKDEPFFAYVPYNAPHYPMHAPQKYVDRFPDLPWDRQIMAAMLSAVDDSVGDILAELKRQGIRDNTVIFIMSDNGPSRETRNWLDGQTDPYYGGSSGGLKGHKFSLYDGGVRVPAIINWPGHIPAGQVINDPCMALDIFPTLITAAGVDLSAYAVDGIDLMPMLSGEAPFSERELYWEMGDQTAVRRGPWKLVLNGQLVEGEAPEDSVHLANVVEDMAESVNRKAEFPELTAELTALAQTWRKGIDTHWDEYWLPRLKGPFVYPD